MGTSRPYLGMMTTKETLLGRRNQSLLDGTCSVPNMVISTVYTSWYLIFTPSKDIEIFIPISQVEKLRLRKVNCLGQEEEGFCTACAFIQHLVQAIS